MPRPNILTVVMDSVRAKNMQVYGYDRNTTPFLKTLSDDWIIYDQARSPGTWSLPSHVSMFTNTHVMEHCISEGERLTAGNTIFEYLSGEMEYSTAAFTTNSWVTSDSFGLNRGFDHISGSEFNLEQPIFEEAYNISQFSPSPDSSLPTKGQYLKKCLKSDKKLKSIINGFGHITNRFENINNEVKHHAEKFVEWQSKQNSPWAAFINTMDAHAPYLPQYSFNRWGDYELKKIHSEYSSDWDYFLNNNTQWKRHALENLYDGCIYQIDQVLQELVASLKKRGDFENTLIIFTSDHGEGFGEPSRIRKGVRTVGHGRGIAEELLHVPLIVKPPKSILDPIVSDKSNAASLTQMPTFIKEIIKNRTVDEGFIPNSPVISSASYNREIPNIETAPEKVNTEQFQGDAIAMYNNKSGYVEKQVKWGADSGTIRVDTALDLLKTSSNKSDIRKVPDIKQSSDLVESREDGIDEETKQRLKELGYR